MGIDDTTINERQNLREAGGETCKVMTDARNVTTTEL